MEEVSAKRKPLRLTMLWFTIAGSDTERKQDLLITLKLVVDVVRGSVAQQGNFCFTQQLLQ